MTIEAKFIISSTICGVLSLILLYRSVPALTLTWSLLGVLIGNIRWLYFIPGLAFAILAAISYGTYRHKPAKNLGFFWSVVMVCFLTCFRCFARYVLWKVDRGCKDLENTQRKVLTDILKHAKHTAYYKENNMDKITTRDEFLANHPVTKYDHYQKWVDRIIDGEGKVMFEETVEFLCATTGTTSGKSKLFPKNKNFVFGLFRRGAWAYAYSLFSLPKAMDAKLFFDIGFKTKIRKTKKGLSIGAFTALFGNSMFGKLSAIPTVAKDIPDMAVAFYVQILFALREKEIGMMAWGMGSHSYTICKLIEDRWVDFCHDIRHGAINEHVRQSIPQYIQDELRPLLKPDPSRADELEREFGKGIQDILPRIWPHASLMITIGTGPFAIYKRIIKDRYAGDLPILTKMHMGTESAYGINIWPDEMYVPLPNTAFYEFIDFDEIDKNDVKPKLAHQLEIGKRYEIVVTTFEGLYRYRTNDIIEITRYYHQAPVYAFVQRADDNLSVYGEKTPVCELTTILESLSRDWHQCDVVDFSTTESIHMQNITGESAEMCYVIILEINGERLTDEQVQQVDKNLCEKVEAYSIYREKNRIGPIKVAYAAAGSFVRLREWILNKNVDASFLQFKVPRLLRKEEHLRVLMEEGGSDSKKEE